MGTRFLIAVVVALFLAGLLATGVLGTETRLLFFWPGAALMGLAAVVAAVRWRWRLSFVPSDLCLAAALVFAAYMVGRQLTSPVVAHAREDLFILLGCFVAYTLSATVFSHAAVRWWVAGVFLLLTLGNLVVGFIHFSGKWSFHIVPAYMRSFGEEQRIGGFYNNPNHVAAFLAMMVMFLMALALFGRGGATRKLLLGFVSLAAAIGVALAVSRGALLGLAGGALVMTVCSMWLLWMTYPHLALKLLGAVGVLAVMGGLVLYGVFAEQLQRRFGLTQVQEGEPRRMIWQAALDQAQTQPLVGAGARMFYEGCITFRQTETPVWLQDAKFVHNEWLQLLADYGMVGLVLLLVVLAVHLRNAGLFLHWFATEKFDRTATLMSNGLGFSLGALSALVVAMIHAVFEFQFHVPATAVTGAFLLGILANPGFGPEGRKPLRVPGCRPLLKLSLLAAGGAMLYGTWVFGRAEYFAEKSQMLSGHDDPETTMERLHWQTRATELDPNNGEMWYQRGLLRLNAAAGQPETLARSLLTRATADLEKARDRNPHSMFPLLALADAYDAQGRPEEAQAAIDGALILAPMYEMPRLTLAIHLHRLGRWKEAEEAYLWAGEARAGRSNESHALYLLLLKDAAAARSKTGR
jgi:O-antigen ligase